MTGPSSPPEPTYTFLIPAVLATSAAVVFTYRGKAWNRFRGWIDRSKEPGRFWWEVGVYYLAGVTFVVCFLLSVFGVF
jgi:undecaprenyl pyrophosphate phosphatase UppP